MFTSRPSPLTRLLLAGELQHIARLTTKHLADSLQRRKIDAHRFAFLQPPQRRVADAGLLCQPIESPLALFQQLIDSNLNQNAPPLCDSSSLVIYEIYHL